MKILMLNYEFPPLGGGASPVSYEITKGLSTLGHEIDIVTMGFKGLKSFEKIGNMSIHRVKCLRKRKEICSFLEMLTYVISAAFFLRKFLKNNNDYNICHTHFIIPTGLVARWVQWRFRIPYLITSHGSDVPGYNPDRFKFLHLFTRSLARDICYHAEKIVSPSLYLLGLINDNIMDLGDKSVQIPNGIFIDRFKPQKKKKIILSTGRLLRRKNFHRLIEAVSNLDLDYELHIAGDGPMMDKLQELAKVSKTRVVLHGWLDNRSLEYKKLLETAEIYCLVSEKENASISLLEAMSAGCVVITSNISGCPETVAEAGFSIAPNDTDKLNEILFKLTNDSELVRKYSQLARKRVEEFYSWSNIIGVYERVLVNKSNFS